MSRDQSFELVDELRAATELELGIDAILDGGQQPLGKLRDLVLREFLEGEIFERLAAPERNRRLQQLRALLGRRPRGLPNEAIEAREVEELRIDAEDVAAGHEAKPFGADRLPQSRHVVLQRRRCRLRRGLPPKLVDETVCGNCLVRVQQEICEQGARQPTVEGDRTTVLDDLQRPENPELHVTFVAPSYVEEKVLRLEVD